MSILASILFAPLHTCAPGLCVCQSPFDIALIVCVPCTKHRGMKTSMMNIFISPHNTAVNLSMQGALISVNVVLVVFDKRPTF